MRDAGRFVELIKFYLDDPNVYISNMRMYMYFNVSKQVH